MRLILVLVLLLPAAAVAQIDLTATPKSAGLTLQILQQHASTWRPAASAPVEWCIADSYRLIAAQTTDRRIETAALRAAVQFDAVATRRLQRIPGGLAVPEGTEVTVRVTDRAVCRTRARVPDTTRG